MRLYILVFSAHDSELSGSKDKKNKKWNIEYSPTRWFFCNLGKIVSWQKLYYRRNSRREKDFLRVSEASVLQVESSQEDDEDKEDTVFWQVFWTLINELFQGTYLNCWKVKADKIKADTTKVDTIKIDTIKEDTIKVNEIR